MAKKASISTPVALAAPSQWKTALLGYVAMFIVGTFYALSSVQIELARILGIPHAWSYASFGVTSLGLSLGVYICTPCMVYSGPEVIAVAGAAVWGAAVAVMGLSLSYLSFRATLAACFVGGVGIGLAYLGVVILIGSAIPTQPLARSAIGPLGFSSGTTAYFVARTHLQFDLLSAAQLGRTLQIGGVMAIVTALLCFVALGSSFRGPGLFSAPVYTRSYKRTRTSHSILLFSNALPGMMVFNSLLPLALLYGQAKGDTVPFCMIALALGGVLAPRLSTHLGCKSTFVVLFVARGVLLIFISVQPFAPVAVATLLTLLFAHGTGFSLLPGLVQSSIRHKSHFAYSYGEVLTAWGMAGFVGSLLNAAVLPTPQ